MQDKYICEAERSSKEGLSNLYAKRLIPSDVSSRRMHNSISLVIAHPQSKVFEPIATGLVIALTFLREGMSVVNSMYASSKGWEDED